MTNEQKLALIVELQRVARSEFEDCEYLAIWAADRLLGGAGMASARRIAEMTNLPRTTVRRKLRRLRASDADLAARVDAVLSALWTRY